MKVLKTLNALINAVRARPVVIPIIIGIGITAIAIAISVIGSADTASAERIGNICSAYNNGQTYACYPG